MPSKTRVNEYVTHLDKLCELAEDELQAVYDSIAPIGDGTLIRDMLVDAMADLSERYGTVASVLAAEFYEETRETEHGGEYIAVMSEPWGSERFEEAVRYAARRFFG